MIFAKCLIFLKGIKNKNKTLWNLQEAFPVKKTFLENNATFSMGRGSFSHSVWWPRHLTLKGIFESSKRFFDDLTMAPTSLRSQQPPVDKEKAVTI